MLPFLLKNCDQTEEVEKKSCEAERKDLLIISMAMQSRAPGTTMNSNAMIPLMLMDDKSPNEDIQMYQLKTRPEILPQC